MIQLSATTSADIPQISEWIAADPHHAEQGHPEWWITAQGWLSFVVTDDEGPIAFVRLDNENGMVRLNTQFGPRTEVSKERLLIAMRNAIPRIIRLAKDFHYKGIVFQSTSESLIKFMSMYNFKPVEKDDYKLDFESEVV
jgi:hypothetical protein